MKTVDVLKPTTEFGRAVAERMDEIGITAKQMVPLTGKSYEGIRKLISGKSYPLPDTVAAFARTLKMDSAALEAMSERDQVRDRFGEKGLTTLQTNPELVEIEKFWRKLSIEQKNMVEQMVRTLAAMNDTSS